MLLRFTRPSQGHPEGPTRLSVAQQAQGSLRVLRVLVGTRVLTRGGQES